MGAGNNDSHWVVGTTFTPKWTSNDSLAETLFGWEGELEGSEFTIGVGRGSTRGGDWMVSYVNKPIEDATVVESESDCFSGSCTTMTETRVLQDVKFTGVEFVWSKPFVTIKDRVQIGITVGGGYANTKGTVNETVAFQSSFTHPVTKQVFNQSLERHIQRSGVRGILQNRPAHQVRSARGG